MTGAPAVDHIGLAVAVMAGSAVVNLVVSARLRRVARETGSPAIEGDAAHLTADVWTSAGAALGLALAWIDRLGVLSTRSPPWPSRAT